jgi:hypothetical protein
VALGVGAAWLINLNLFAVWSIPVRNSDIAVTLTGIMIGGAAWFWQALVGFFGGLSRKFTDQARTWRRPSTCAAQPEFETRRSLPRLGMTSPGGMKILPGGSAHAASHASCSVAVAQLLENAESLSATPEMTPCRRGAF